MLSNLLGRPLVRSLLCFFLLNSDPDQFCNIMEQHVFSKNKITLSFSWFSQKQRFEWDDSVF